MSGVTAAVFDERAAIAVACAVPLETLSPKNSADQRRRDLAAAFSSVIPEGAPSDWTVLWTQAFTNALTGSHGSLLRLTESALERRPPHVPDRVGDGRRLLASWGPDADATAVLAFALIGRAVARDVVLDRMHKANERPLSNTDFRALRLSADLSDFRHHLWSIVRSPEATAPGRFAGALRWAVLAGLVHDHPDQVVAVLSPAAAREASHTRSCIKGTLKAFLPCVVDDLVHGPFPLHGEDLERLFNTNEQTATDPRVRAAWDRARLIQSIGVNDPAGTDVPARPRAM